MALSQQGRANGRAVLTATIVKWLRRHAPRPGRGMTRARTGFVVQQAERLGVDPSTITSIIKRKTWKHVR